MYQVETRIIPYSNSHLSHFRIGVRVTLAIGSYVTSCVSEKFRNLVFLTRRMFPEWHKFGWYKLFEECHGPQIYSRRHCFHTNWVTLEFKI